MLQLSLQLPFCLEIQLTRSLFYPQIPQIFFTLWASHFRFDFSTLRFCWWKNHFNFFLYFLTSSTPSHLFSWHEFYASYAPSYYWLLSLYVQDISTSNETLFNALDLCSQYFLSASFMYTATTFFSLYIYFIFNYWLWLS